MRSRLIIAGALFLVGGPGCIDPATSPTTIQAGWTLTQRMPSGGVGQVSEGNSGSAGQVRVASSQGTAQVLVGVLDPHTRAAARPEHHLLQLQEVNLVHATGVPGNP